MRRMLIAAAVTAGAIMVPAAAQAAPGSVQGAPPVYSPSNPPQVAYVCNEAQSSWKGQTYVDSADPNPPARDNKTNTNMPVGRGKGLVNAAENSPALALCGGGEG